MWYTMLLGRVHPLVYTRARFLSSSILPVQATQPAAATVVCFRIQPKDLWFRFPVPCLVLPIETGPVQCCPVLAIEPGPVKIREGRYTFQNLKQFSLPWPSFTAMAPMVPWLPSAPPDPSSLSLLLSWDGTLVAGSGVVPALCDRWRRGSSTST